MTHDLTSTSVNQAHTFYETETGEAKGKAKIMFMQITTVYNATGKIQNVVEQYVVNQFPYWY